MTHEAHDEWPTFSQELTRKGTAVLERWMKAHAAGKINNRELYILTSGLWDTMSGLCDRELLRLLEQVHQEIRDASKPK